MSGLPYDHKRTGCDLEGERQRISDAPLCRRGDRGHLRCIEPADSLSRSTLRAGTAYVESQFAQTSTGPRLRRIESVTASSV